jgi:hypothetical protein
MVILEVSCSRVQFDSYSSLMEVELNSYHNGPLYFLIPSITHLSHHSNVYRHSACQHLHEDPITVCIGNEMVENGGTKDTARMGLT